MTLFAFFSAMATKNIVISAPVFREKEAPFELVTLAHSGHKSSFPVDVTRDKCDWRDICDSRPSRLSRLSRVTLTFSMTATAD